MARYVQRISLLGKERWIGWEVDGVGTEIPGLMLADHLTEEELAARGIREFRPLPFENFLGLGASTRTADVSDLLDEDIEFRLDALMVAIERLRMSGTDTVPRALLVSMLGSARVLADKRVQWRLSEWAVAGAVEIVGVDDCYLRIKGRIA